jgi:hypothetical protein
MKVKELNRKAWKEWQIEMFEKWDIEYDLKQDRP